MSTEMKSAGGASAPTQPQPVAPFALPDTYRAIKIVAKGELKMEMVPLKMPSARQVLVKVISCGLCHTDAMVISLGMGPGCLGRVPGHEVVGIVAAVGSEVTRFKIGDRVGRGYHGGQCFQCDNCFEGEFFACTNTPGPTGVNADGGFAEFMLAPFESLARVNPNLPLSIAGPLCCAGITCFNALRHSGAVAGDLVAIQGIGGLGHLGVQYARQMGFRTVAISTGSSKAALAKELGAHVYIDTSTQDAALELQKLGGARAILTTTFDSKSQASLVGGLGRDGQLMCLGVDAANPMSINGLSLILSRASIRGWYAGVAKDIEDTLNFSALTGVKSVCEFFPLEKFEEAYRRMMSGDARFRVVLSIAPDPSQPPAALPIASAVPVAAPSEPLLKSEPIAHKLKAVEQQQEQERAIPPQTHATHHAHHAKPAT